MKNDKSAVFCLDISRMTEDELNSELKKGYNDMKKGTGELAETAFKSIRKELGILSLC